MNLSFIIDYRTNWGEAVYINGNIPQLGNGDKSKAVKLDLYGEQTWKPAFPSRMIPPISNMPIL